MDQLLSENNRANTYLNNNGNLVLQAAINPFDYGLL